jgi:plastocyanin
MHPPRRTPMFQVHSSRRSFVTLFALVLLVVSFSGAAHAHGPTVKISHSEVTPPLLNLYVGTTVHFSNTVSMPGGHIIVDEAGTLESPPLEEPGDGWHYTFENEGTYEIYVKQHPKAKMRIVVVPKK